MASTDLTSILPTLILALVAIYGAGLSTYNFLNDRKKEKSQVSVDIDWLWDEEDFGGVVLRATARNTGWKTVTLDYLEIEEYIKPKRRRIFSKKEIIRRVAHVEYIKNDNELLSGKKYEFMKDTDSLEEERAWDMDALTKSMDIIVVFVDQLGNRYKSKPLLSQNKLIFIEK
jgi:hypothetical protein